MNRTQRSRQRVDADPPGSLSDHSRPETPFFASQNREKIVSPRQDVLLDGHCSTKLPPPDCLAVGDRRTRRHDRAKDLAHVRLPRLSAKSRVFDFATRFYAHRLGAKWFKHDRTHARLPWGRPTRSRAPASKVTRFRAQWFRDRPLRVPPFRAPPFRVPPLQGSTVQGSAVGGSAVEGSRTSQRETI